MKFALLATLLTLLSCTKTQNENRQADALKASSQPLTTTDCRTTPSTCSAVDIDSPSAKPSYQFGCQHGDSNSCYRLGQFYETKTKDLPSAVAAYEESCTEYKEGCNDERELRSRLCYFAKNKTFCKGEPEGEYKIFVFLETLDPKYKDVFVRQDFSKGLSLEPVRALYSKRVEEKNKKLLEALRLAKKEGSHDGDDGETLQRDIWKIEGNKKAFKDVE